MGYFDAGYFSDYFDTGSAPASPGGGSSARRRPRPARALFHEIDAEALMALEEMT